MWKPKNDAEREAADKAVGFFRQLRHVKGKWSGVPFDLMPWQQQIIRPLFGALNRDGTRKYRIAYTEVPRKGGKSETAAGVALKLLFGDGEAGGEVYGAAEDRDQASIVFSIAAQMVRNNPGLESRSRVIDSSKRIIVTKGPGAGSFYRAIPADAAGSHGFNASGVIFDEIHTQRSRELWDVLITSTGAREQPLVFGITTAGFDRNSICWELHEHALQVLDGTVDDPSFFAYVSAADPEDDWRDPKTWRKANPSLGVTVPESYYAQEARRAEQVPAYQNTFRRLLLNQWTSQDERWLDMQAWDSSSGLISAKSLRGRVCYGGLDLATRTDIAAFVLVFPPEDEHGGYAVLPFFWVPRDNIEDRARRDRVPYAQWARDGLIEATEGNVIDYATIRTRIRQLAAEFRLAEVAFDRWDATQMSQELDEEGLAVIPIGQGFASMASPTKELLRLVLERRLHHGGHPVLRWMCDNLRVEQDPAGNLKPSKRKSTEKIDGMVALIMALDRALRNESGPSVYEKRGVDWI